MSTLIIKKHQNYYFQSLKLNSYDHHAAIYLLLLERLRQQRSLSCDSRPHSPLAQGGVLIMIFGINQNPSEIS